MELPVPFIIMKALCRSNAVIIQEAVVYNFFTIYILFPRQFFILRTSSISLMYPVSYGRNNGSDCSQSMTPDNLELVRSSCSYQTTCSTRAQWAGKVACESGFAVSSTYDVLRADCISGETTPLRKSSIQRSPRYDTRHRR